MVLAFVLLSPGGRPAPCRLLYARSFGPPPHDRLLRKEQLLAVARQVSSHCHLQHASSGRPPASPLPEDPSPLHAAPGGLFHLPPGDPFPGRATVTWLAAPSVALALVCEAHENLTLAEGTLRLLAGRLTALLRPHGPGLLLRPEAADLVLDRLLPHGQLLFLSRPFLHAVERDGGGKAAR
ncbi:AP-5 complex subunit sigma-1 [Cyrtonyx montezumae]|uniref:AP-5 complex subunit sigma-1 n=1 Tax=Cyrtonyx montezumae TaxID=9017 RepID=UPI0032DAB207